MRKALNGNIVLKVIAVILSLVILCIGFIIASKIWENAHGNEGETQTTTEIGSLGLPKKMSYNGKEYSLKKNVETFLVLGLDKTEKDYTDSYNNTMQADFLFLLVIDNKNQEVSAIHINRDTMVEMDVLGVSGDIVASVNKQIALAHTYGNGKEVSCGNTSRALSRLLNGVKIDHYISVTMDAVPVFNDFVGGVELEILDDFSGVDETLVKGETIKLNGEQAFNYVRTRYGLEDSTNSTRMIRQRQYINALYDIASRKAQNDESFISSAALKLSEYIVSDCNTTRLETLFEKLSNYKFQDICEIEGKNQNGEEFIEFYPSEDSIQKILIDNFYE